MEDFNNNPNNEKDLNESLSEQQPLSQPKELDANTEHDQSFANQQQVNIGQQVGQQQIELRLPFLKSLAGWATFKAVIDIILGALSCLGLITAAYGIPKIISGVKLLNATDDLKRYMNTNDNRRIGDALYNFSKYFKISGISIIINIALSVIMIIISIILMTLLVNSVGNIFNNIPNYNIY